MLKCVKNIKKNAFFLRKIWFFGVYGIILQMYTIFIIVMEGKSHGISSFPTVPPLHPFLRRDKETEKGETIKY